MGDVQLGHLPTTVIGYKITNSPPIAASGPCRTSDRTTRVRRGVAVLFGLAVVFFLGPNGPNKTTKCSKMFKIFHHLAFCDVDFGKRLGAEFLCEARYGSRLKLSTCCAAAPNLFFQPWRRYRYVAGSSQGLDPGGEAGVEGG